MRSPASLSLSCEIAGLDDDGVGFGGELDGALVDDGALGGDADEQMAAHGAGLPFFDDDFVRAGGEVEGDGGLEGADLGPVVEDELAVEEEAVAVAFAGVFEGDDVFACGFGLISGGEAMRDRGRLDEEVVNGHGVEVLDEAAEAHAFEG